MAKVLVVSQQSGQAKLVDAFCAQLEEEGVRVYRMQYSEWQSGAEAKLRIRANATVFVVSWGSSVAFDLAARKRDPQRPRRGQFSLELADSPYDRPGRHDLRTLSQATSQSLAKEIAQEAKSMSTDSKATTGALVAIVVALISAIAAVISAWISNSQREAAAAGQVKLKEQVEQATLRATQDADTIRRQVVVLGNTTAGSLEKGQKLCRVLQRTTWRDGLIVPQNWTVSLCVDYMKKTGGTGYQLGCIYADGTNLGREDGSLPSPNCGWQ